MALNLNAASFLPLQRSRLPPPLRLLPPKFISIRPKLTRLGFRLRSSSSSGIERRVMAEGPVTVKEKIDLTEKEEKIFHRLLDVLKHFQLDTQLRVAGGCVRDKILGKYCYDIDIALDNMLGREFCDKVNEYLKHAGEEQQTVGVIHCNPGQSKHLETARMHIYDTWIDFVNLRSETYVENSRIPTMKFGTAEEDAYRRDLTINRLCISYMDASWNALQLIGPSKFSIPVTRHFFRNSLKLKANDAEMVVSLHAACERFISLIPFLESTSDSEIVKSELENEYLDIPQTSRRRVLAGLLLRQIKDFWRVALLMSTLLYPSTDLARDSDGHFDLDRRKEIFLSVESTINELELDNVWELKPLLDGKAIMGVLQLKTGGPLVREWHEKVLRWQLAHPERTAEDCLDWMRESQAKRAKLDFS